MNHQVQCNSANYYLHMCIR